MLFRVATLERIKAGQITLAFRRWRRPTVKTGGSLKTPVGVLNITRVDPISTGGISTADARRAGFSNKAELLQELNARDEGAIYRIEFTLAGPDPRIQLRQDDQLTDQEFGQIKKKLDRMDRASPQGPWTRQLLTIIEAHPRVVAKKLAEQTGWEKEAFKLNVRKLKNLGLTISHSIGYEVSPRGKAVLKRIGPDPS